MAETNSTKLWMFRLVACGVPLCIGFTLVAWLLFSQERIAVDPKSGAIEWRTGPIYLEEPGHEVTGHRYIYDERLGWRNIPNWRASTRGFSLSINSKGLRDREYTYEKPEAVKRILVLGDSFAWGYGVSDHEIFTEVLETRLEQNPTAWEVINTGVSGWGTDQEYLYLLEEGFRYEPDIVILSFFLVNDPDNNARSPQYGLNKPVFLDESLTLANVPVPTPFEREVRVTSRARQLSLTLAIIQAMADECTIRDVRLIVAKFGAFLQPESHRMRDWDKEISTRMADDAASIFYLDLDKRFADGGISREQLLEGNDDGHWNAFGHEQVGEIMFEFMNKQGLLTPVSK